MVVFDFDGVFTNNKVIVSDEGKESVICDRSDGLGLKMLREKGVLLFILSTEKNLVVMHRAKKLGIDCIHGCENKLMELRKIAKTKKILFKEIAFVGNDINDLECLKNVGLPIVVADAYREVKDIAKIILKKKGGDGAVREACEYILIKK